MTLAGCGGGAKAPVTVRGDGYSFSAPGGWKVTRTGSSLAAAHGSEAVSVTTFRLPRPYRPRMWLQAVHELDGVAARLAAQLGGTVAGSRTVYVGTTAARQYDLAFTRRGDRLIEQITFVLHGRREYELLCRFKEGKEGPSCPLLLVSFVGG